MPGSARNAPGRITGVDTMTNSSVVDPKCPDCLDSGLLQREGCPPDACPRGCRVRPLEHLRILLANGLFHHATYRNKGTLWEGLWIYAKDPTGFRGYRPATCIAK